MINVKITYVFSKDGEREAFLKDIKDNEIDKKTWAEKGCLCYDYYMPFAVKGGNEGKTLLLFEKWENQDCLDSHFTQNHFKLLKEIKEKYTVDTLKERF